uniref:Helicase with zinc finger 2 n=1 Tax=Pelodiscus sinensis TaxID=13735 RepID=K7G1I5_PELSI
LAGAFCFARLGKRRRWNNPSSPSVCTQKRLELCLVCSKCSVRENESTYERKEVEHRCMYEILLARCRSKRSQLWRKVGRRPGFPKPARYEVCRFYCPGAGCSKHHNQCTFASSKEEALVWNFEREQELERRLRAQVAGSTNGLPSEEASSTAGQIRSEFGGQFQEICRLCFCQSPQKISFPGPAGLCEEHWAWDPLLVHVVTEGTRKKQYTAIRPWPRAMSQQESFENHCSLVEHARMVSADATNQWVHRAPPYGLATFALCSRGDICTLGDGCTQAHSVEELQEWIQRAKAAERSRKSALRDGLLSYQDRLIAEYQECRNEIFILSEEVDGVRITCEQPMRVHSEDRKMRYRWKFAVHSQAPLRHVALLKRDPGATFFLAGEGIPRGLTYIRGERVKALSASPRVWLGGGGGGGLVNFQRWHSGNRVIVPSVEMTSHEVNLLAKYKAPALSLEFQRDSAPNTPITRLNYKERMHHFLFREEEAEQTLIDKLNLQVAVSLTPMLQTLSVGMKIALPGELFAEVPIPWVLTPDTSEGYLLSRAVNTALLAPAPPTDNRVYEVKVESKATTEKSIWLLLPPRCCSELGFQPDTTRQVEIQFQIDRLQFRLGGHAPLGPYAVDQLLDERLILPDVAACSIPPSPTLPRIGNRKQNQAISFITGPATGPRPVPPLLIYGPFGTGKTFTLAMATREIIKQPNTRVLICTHTNSAADIYVREYFHEYVTSGHPGAIPLRIKYTDRAISLTDPITRLYCCLSPDQMSFRQPTPEELNRHRIIITTSMLSKNLRVSPGYFTHILIDEAAQMLECEALVPLSYATFETRIVLAGDHMQVTPKLFCLGGGQSADHTLLNRLFQYYQREKHEVALKSRIIFNENYRSTAGIIEFVSKNFYVSKGNAIHASGNIPPHPEIHPLMFCHVPGSTERDMAMTSWYNVSEIMQVIEKVQEMRQKWPDEWGARDLKRICVVSHGMQVNAIRQELKKKQLGEVAVENFENLPGREFRVILISTVHTKESLLSAASPNMEFFNEARVLNTIMTRAQSQVIAVGDAVALCSYGECSKVWKRFVQECIEKGSVTPATLTLEQIKQAVSDQQGWVRRGAEAARLCEEEGDSDTDSWASELENVHPDDPILQELLDESKHLLVTVSEEGLLNVKSEAAAQQNGRLEYVSFSPRVMLDYLRMHPKMYKRCELIKEGFDRATAIAFDDSPPLNIQIKGRVHCGMAFTGDQVLVELLQSSSAEGGPTRPHGKVVGVLKQAERERTFVCMMDEFDPRVMIPIDRTVTKIFVPGLKEKPNVLAIRRQVKGKFQVVSCEKINQEMKRSRLFCVQVISWREGFYYPLGIVTEVLPMALTLEEGLKILNLEYGLTKEYPSEVTKELAKLTSSKPKLPKESVRDCRGYLTFTVDPPGSRDLDDAISLRDEGSCYEIGIHIADVAGFVPKDSALDVEARKRGITYYAPGKEPLCMFPPRISQDLCSLLPLKDRRVVSLFVTVEKKTDKVMNGVFALSTIRSDRQLSYEAAESIIKSHYRGEREGLSFDTLEDCVAAAYHFSRVHRKFRLQEDCYYDRLDEDSTPGDRGSHQMIEEFMIMFNSFVAEFLTNKDHTRDITPLRCQMEPNPQQLRQMKNKYSHVIPLSIHLSHALSPQPHRTCEARPLLLARRRLHLGLLPHPPLRGRGGPAALARRAGQEAGAVRFGRHRVPLPRLQQEERAGGDVREAGPFHYSLHVDAYTWASSPIRRYVDVVVQRHLHAVLGKKPVLYASDDIEFLCHDFNRKNVRAGTYERRAPSLQMATQLQCQVLQKIAFVVSVEGTNRFFKALFPLNNETLPDPQVISYRSLQLVEQPLFLQEQGSMRLTWKRRMYSMASSKERTPRTSPLGDRNITPFSAQVWRDMLAAVRGEELERAMALLGKGQPPRQRQVGRMERSECSHYVGLSLELSPGDALQLQLTTDVFRGFLVPIVQLWSVAPGFDVCLQHTEKPIDCFSRYATLASRDAYKSPSDYTKVWKPLSAMESATCAVAENDSIVLQEVRIVWDKQRNRKGQLQGTFSFTKSFLEECAIEVDFNHCYLCIRLEGLPLKLHLSHEGPAGSPFVVDPATYTWVAHGLTEEFGDNEKQDRSGEKTVNFYLHFMSMEEVPAEVSRDSSRFTVELIPKMLPDVRKENALWKLQNASELAKSIALGQEPPQTVWLCTGAFHASRSKQWPPYSVNGETEAEKAHPGATRSCSMCCLCGALSNFGGFVLTVAWKKSKLLTQKVFDLPGSLRKLNHSQHNAILEALRKSFTLIQGPPGTGKTVVGVHIVYWLNKLNEEKLEKEVSLEKEKAGKCILYCGPSNKSVDVVAEMLLKMKGSLKPLRVYGEMMELMEFPYPGSNRHVSRKAMRDAKPKSELSEIILHHRIRQPPNPLSPQIREFDARVKKGEAISEDEVKKHKGLLSEARAWELQRHNVILCTCSAASAASLVEHLNVKQILIDECAMSTEPETLIPLVSYERAEKVILLGDHKQLRPVVQNDFCKNLGMETSLFERYRDQALMLDTQYRMQREICRFPSQEFYKSKLMTSPELRRPNSALEHQGRSCPILFGHIEGKEQSLMVSTEEGNENSKANLEEVEQAVRIAKQLTLGGTILPAGIAILSPYSAQVSEINKRLAQQGIRGMTVCTITKSQGSEWKYVILSTVRSCARSDIDRRPTKSWQKKNLGFVTDPNQVNVAITRAQEGLCIIGNRYLLECNPLWRRLLEHYRHAGCYTFAQDIQVRKKSALR